MRDPRTFRAVEDGTFIQDEIEDEEPKMTRPFERLPLLLSGPLLDIEAINNYGSLLEVIKSRDVAKCSSNELISYESPKMRRLSREIKCFIKDSPRYISVAPIGNSILQLLGSFEGPPGTSYEDGVFFVRLDIPEEYPFKPPVCNFMTKIYHPNIADGKIYINILEDEWNCTFSISSVLLSICSMLSQPIFDEPLLPEIAEQYNTNPEEYGKIAREWTQKYATKSMPSEEELENLGGRNDIFMAQAWETKL